MIATVIGFTYHALVSSFKVLHSVVPVLEYVTPYFNMTSSNINFNTKHLGKGDPLPPYNGKLRVYNMRYCPYAQRTILALNAKQVDYEVVNIDLMNKPEWLFSKSAFGKVPSLEIADGTCIYESLVTVEYIDQVYPQRPLLSKDPVRRAFDKIIVEAMGPIQLLLFKTLKSPETITEDVKTAYTKALDFIQDQLKLRGTTFLSGDEPGYVDYMIWPWFERIVLLDGFDGALPIDPQKYKLLLDYLNEMFKDPAVAQYLIPKEILSQFMDFYRKGLPINYDLLLK